MDDRVARRSFDDRIGRMGRVDVHAVDITHLRKRLAQEGQNL